MEIMASVLFVSFKQCEDHNIFVNSKVLCNCEAFYVFLIVLSMVRTQNRSLRCSIWLVYPCVGSFIDLWKLTFKMASDYVLSR